MRRAGCWGAAAALAGAVGAWGEAPAAAPTGQVGGEDQAWFERFEKVPTAAIEHLERGVFRIGKVVANQLKGTLTMPGKVITPTWPDLEYLAITPGGKDHESVLVMDVEPLHVNLACILLGLKGTDKPLRFQGDPQPPKGDAVRLWVEWTPKGATAAKRVPAEQLVWDQEAEKPMPSASWVYTGSRFDDENRFMAQGAKALVAVFHDPDALFDHQLKGGGEPHRYRWNEKGSPAPETAITLVVEVGGGKAPVKKPEAPADPPGGRGGKP